MSIRGIEGMSDADILAEVQKGGRFVYMYCFSVLVLTFRRGTDVYFLKAGESGFKHSMGWTAMTLFLGWWGVPWGPIYSIQCLYTNLRGGRDVTNEIVRRPG